MKLIYLCHPVSGDVQGNLARAKLWLKYATEHFTYFCGEPVAVIAPWITDCEIWDDSNPEERAAGLARCRAVLERCDAVCLVGGRISDGMRMEYFHATENHMTVADLTYLGPLPPETKESPVAPSPTIDPAQLSPAVGKTAEAVEAMQASVRRATGKDDS